jgi:hypothetical protein
VSSTALANAHTLQLHTNVMGASRPQGLGTAQPVIRETHEGRVSLPATPEDIELYFDNEKGKCEGTSPLNSDMHYSNRIDFGVWVA